MTRAVVTRARTNRGLTLLATLALALLVAAGAVAYFTSIGAGTSTATVGTLPAPVIASVTPGSGTVDLSWAPGITPPGSGAATYYVQRDGGNAAGCPTAAAPTGVTSCTDTDPPAGSHTYTVTAVWRSWTATSDPDSGTPHSAPTVTTTSPSSRGQGAASQNIVITGTGFLAGAVASFSGIGITVNSTTYSSDTSLTANVTIAGGASTGIRNVTVTNPDTGAGTGVGVFAINAGPTVTSGTPSSRPQGAVNQSIVIAGTGFASGAVASFSGAGITVNSTTFVSATQVTANITIAAGATSGSRDITVTNPDGGTGVGSALFTVNSALTVTATSPSFRNQGATNQNIAIIGTNFASGATVAFSGTGITLNSTTFNSPTQITANISISGGAPTGARNVTVTNPDSGTDTGIGVFTVNPAPTLVSATPSSRGRGATNQDITLTGTGFISGASLAASFGSQITVNSTTFVSATSLTANITVGATATTGARSVTVTNGDGTNAAGNVFTVTAAPTVTSATPASRGQGAVNQNIAIVGTGFVSGAAVSFSGAGITVNSTTFNTATSLTANITIGEDATTGLRDVLVTNPDAGVGTRTGGFTVNTGPTVASATPDNRGQGATSQNIVILGTGFATGAAASFSGSGITVNSTTRNSATQLTANITIAAGATVGARDVIVTNASTDAGRGTATGIFTVVGAPTVSSASPNNRGRGAANQTIVITGTNFAGGATVTFSGTRITVNSTTVDSTTQITANVSIAGNAATGLRDVIVNNNNGGTTGTCTGCFTVNPVLTTTAVTPNSRGQGATNQNITLTGTNYLSGATVTSFSGTGITVNSTTFNSSTSLTVNISISPTAALGNRRVTVDNNDGSAAVLSGNIFTVAAAPTVTSVTPSSRGQGAVSQSIAVAGTGFVSGAVASFSGTGITVNSTTFVSATSLTVNVTIAAGAATGPRDVVVTNPNAGVGTMANGFTVNTGPTVASTSPASRPRGTVNQNVVVTGTGFVAGAVASFSGTGITVNSTTFNSATQVTVNITIAAGAAVGARDVTVVNTDAGRGTGTGIFTVT